MPTLGEIEALAKDFATAREALGTAVQDLEDEVQTVKRKRLARIKRLVGNAAEAEARLKAGIEAAPDLFQKPRTLIMHGVKVGFAKGKGRLEFSDPAKVVQLIRKHFPDKSEELVKVTEAPVRGALNQMSVQDLRKIGVTVVEAGDEVVIRPTDGDIDKLVDALLKDATDNADSAAA